MTMVYRYISRGLSGSFDVNLGTDVIRLGSIPGFTERASHCQVGTSNIILDDPDADLGDNDEILGLQFFRVDETDMASGNQLLYLGLIGSRQYRRGDGQRPSLRTEAARQITMTLMDCNSLLGLRAIPKSDTAAIRPAESVDDRLTWILGSDYLDGIVADNGLVTYPATMMTAADYRTQRPVNVINDCEMAGRYYAFVYLDETEMVIPSLFFDNANTSTAYLSDIFLTNDLSLVDNVNVFAVEPDVSLTRSPDEVGSHVLLPYSAGVRSRTLSATADVYGLKSLIAPNSNVKTSSKADDIADDFLDEHATEEDVISGVVKLPSNAVNRMRAGQRVGFLATHLPGYTTWKWARVVQRAPAQGEETDKQYQIPFELSPQEPLDSQPEPAPDPPAPPPPAGANPFESFDRASFFWNSGDPPDDWMGIPSSADTVPWDGSNTTLFFTNADGQQIAGVNADGEFFYRIDLFNTGGSPGSPVAFMEAILDPLWGSPVVDSAWTAAANTVARAEAITLTFRVWVQKWTPSAAGGSHDGLTDIVFNLAWMDTAETGFGQIDLHLHRSYSGGMEQIDFDWYSGSAAPNNALTVADTVDNQWHTFKFEIDWSAQTYQGKMWADSVSEPDWMWFGENDTAVDVPDTGFMDTWIGVQGNGDIGATTVDSYSLKLDDFLEIL